MEVSVAELEGRNLGGQVGGCEVVEGAVSGAKDEKGVADFVDHK